MGRYGTRVGRKLRNEAVKVEVDRRKASGCPTCSRGKLKRVSAGVWMCRTCGYTFTGGSHVPVVRRVTAEEEQ